MGVYFLLIEAELLIRPTNGLIVLGDRTFENQQYRASGLNLVVAAIILWKTVYLSRAVDQLRAEGHDLPDDLCWHTLLP